MHIQTVHFQNYRGIRDVKLDFRNNGNLIVLAGVNGSGKSSILDGIAMLLRELDYGMYGDKRIPFETKDISNGTEESQLEMVLGHPYSPDQIPLGYQKQREANSRLKVLHKKELDWGMEIWLSNASWTTDAHHYPSVVFAQSEILDEKGFHDWLLGRINYENALKVADSKQRYPLLDAVREALAEFSGLQLAIQTQAGKVEVGFQKGDKTLTFTQLSQGEKRMTMMVVEITRRLAYPHQYDRSPLGFHGIVLIDEIDQHLHPRWQQSILPSLKRTFPNVQFIVASHAPLVLSSVPPEDVWLLKREEDTIQITHPGQSYGKDTNWILTEIMEAQTRTAELSREFEKIQELLEGKSYSEVRSLIESLLYRIGNDAELNAQLALLRRREVLGR
ncbi:MAG: AAA family ATPase [Bacteroidota bacterium]